MQDFRTREHMGPGACRMKGHVGAVDTQDLGTIGTRGHVGPGNMQDQGTQGTREHVSSEHFDSCELHGAE